MIIVRLKGGMGNQMFQYAFGKAMAAKLGTEMKMDLSILLDRARGKDFVYRDYDLDIFHVDHQFSIDPDKLRKIYKLKFSKVSNLTRKQLEKGKEVRKERFFHLDTELLANPTDNTIYNGWWQSGKYFESIAAEIRKDFQFVDELLPESKELLHKIQQTDSVCLNVRRTDFLTNPTLNATNLNYFLQSAKRMAQEVENSHFFVFSDDVEWCRENIKTDYPVEVVSHDHKGRKFGNYMQLMIACKHYIIPNSSYAWWAVWLNKNPQKVVIAPKKWTNEPNINTDDLVGQNWIRM